MNCSKMLLFLPPILFAGSVLALHEQTSSPLEPTRLLINATPLEEAAKGRFSLPLDGGEKEAEEAERHLREIVSGENVALTGFASLVEANLGSIQKQPEYRGSDPRCEKALEEKKRWHEEHGGRVPDAFGKIINYDVYEVDARRQLWAGTIETCSWVGNAQYYFKMEFKEGVEGQLRAVARRSDPANPFPHTLDISALEPAEQARLLAAMNRWDWKLHANGRAIDFVEAKKDGVDLPPGDPLFSNPESNCFDMFFLGGYPENRRLPASQYAYCMGRCDARVINTP